MTRARKTDHEVEAEVDRVWVERGFDDISRSLDRVSNACVPIPQFQGEDSTESEAG